MYAHRNFIGGCIWEWADHTVLKNGVQCYGGDFEGELTDDGNFCCGLTVKAGPVEATALGNIMIQLKALGLLDSITQGRRLVAETEVIKTYTPSTQNYAEWNAAYDRFKPLL